MSLGYSKNKAVTFSLFARDGQPIHTTKTKQTEDRTELILTLKPGEWVVSAAISTDRYYPTSLQFLVYHDMAYVPPSEEDY